nr:4Fe-4S dicluster domain-containing protein [PVC group bacterium]
VPYAHRPEGTIPGIAEHYASCFDFGGVAQGVLVTSNDGRPTKIEGNPSHPDSQGATDSFTQAAILDLYDPDRSRKVSYDGKTSSMAAFKDWIASYLPNDGSGVAVLAEQSSSPTFRRMQREFMKSFPNTTWVEYDPVANTNELAGLASAFGGNWKAVHDISNATTIVSLDADILGAGPLQVPNTRGWAASRNGANGKMNRMWVAESALTLSGANADERIAVKPERVTAIATAIGSAIVGGESAKLTSTEQEWVDRLVSDLTHAGSHGLVVAGASQQASVHHLVARINEAIGAAGNTVSYRTVDSSTTSISELASMMKSKAVQSIIVIGGNPAYDAPSELGFETLLKSAAVSIHLSLYEDETSKACKWHINRAHWLESWGDGRSADGTICIGQPLIQPLFDGITPSELLAIVSGLEKTDGQTLVRETFGVNNELWDPRWRSAVHDGVVNKTASLENPPVNRSVAAPTIEDTAGITVVFAPCSSVWDGRFCNNGWLQEIPDTITKITWDNAAIMSPATARGLGVTHGDVVKVRVGNESVSIVALPVPGTADAVVVLPLGYGRRFAGRVCTDAGTDVYPLRKNNSWFAPAKVSATGDTYPLATTQMHFAVDSTPGRGTQERLPLLFREGTLEQYKNDSHFAQHVGHTLHSLSMFEEEQFEGAQYKWGMSFALSSCTGCNACVTACQAENNISIVGKEQVLMGREMQWLRIDRYFAFEGNGKGRWDGDKLAAVAIQPMTCTHCENAPCEEVCPVAATVHDTDGLNTMVYNRCIGTRYCSNNCPFKVRRFNYFDYFRRDPLRSAGMLQVQPDYYIKAQSGGKTLRAMQFNPDVTVRMRGVMEKCTYCTQRIQRAKISTKNAWVKKSDAEKTADPRVAIQDGAIITACQQACPAGAIVFGDLFDKESRISKLHENSRTYEILEELNIKSRTKYLARLTNPVDSGTAAGGSHH